RVMHNSLRSRSYWNGFLKLVPMGPRRRGPPYSHAARRFATNLRAAHPPTPLSAGFRFPIAGPNARTSPAAPRSARRRSGIWKEGAAMKLLRMATAPLLVGVLVGVAYVGQATESAGAKMTAAAQKFLDTLSAEQKAKAVIAFDDKERTNWHFTPRE